MANVLTSCCTCMDSSGWWLVWDMMGGERSGARNAKSEISFGLRTYRRDDENERDGGGGARFFVGSKESSSSFLAALSLSLRPVLAFSLSLLLAFSRAN